MLCLSDVGRKGSQGKGQLAASILEVDSLQESAPEMCLWSPKLEGLQILAISRESAQGPGGRTKTLSSTAELMLFFFLREKTEKKKIHSVLKTIP